MAAEVVPIVNCYCYGDDISSEEKEKTTAFYSRHADVSLHVGLYTCMVYGSYRPLRNKYTFYTFPLNLGEIYQTGAVEFTRPSRLSVEGMRSPEWALFSILVLSSFFPVIQAQVIEGCSPVSFRFCLPLF